MGQRLTERLVEHVVLERGDIGESWRTKRWPGLRLLTPNWMLALPAAQADPDGFLSAADVADLLSG
jgi:putative flavoprotein involved in K+ transport